MSQYKVDYPVYAAKLYKLPKTSRQKQTEYLIITGGGGVIASGIKNKLGLYSITDDRGNCLLSEITSESTDESVDVKNCAPMSMSIFGKFIVLGLGNLTKLYEIEFNELNTITQASGRIRKRKDSKSSTRKRSTSNSGLVGRRDSECGNQPQIKLKILATNPDETLDPKICPITHVSLSAGSTLLTGGSNNNLSVFKINMDSLSNKISLPEYKIKSAHNGEIKQISTFKNLVCTIGFDDKACYVWELGPNSFKKCWSFKEIFEFDHNINSKYSFEAVSWFDHGIKIVPVYLITCHAPVLSKSKNGSIICIWRYCQNSPEKFQLINSRNLTPDVGYSKISSRALFVDTERKLVAVGFGSGQVMIYNVPEFTPYFKHEPENLDLAYTVTNVVISENFIISTSTDSIIRSYRLEKNYSEFWSDKVKVFGTFLVLILFIFILIQCWRMLK